MAEAPPTAAPPSPGTPWWTWVFVVTCLVPIWWPGGWICGALGGGFAALCFSLGHSRGMVPKAKFARMAAATVTCFGLSVAVGALQLVTRALSGQG